MSGEESGKCPLCLEIEKGENILYTSPNFSVFPALGQMGIEGYSLVVTNDHKYRRMADLPPPFFPELKYVIDVTKEIVENEYGPTILGEHGPAPGPEQSGVQSVDHAHFSLIPTQINLHGQLEAMARPEKPKKISSIDELGKVSNGFAYLLYQSQRGTIYHARVPSQIPTQWFRRSLADKLGIREFSWETNPDYETFKATLRTLKEKFPAYSQEAFEEYLAKS